MIYIERKNTIMKIHEKYLEALKTFNGYIIVSDWAIKVGEYYPDLLEKANKEALNQKTETTGIREIAARISSQIPKYELDGVIQVDKSERPKKVKYITKEEFDKNTKHDIEEDLEPLTRKDKEKNAEDNLALKELYRLEEFKNIQKQFKTFFNLDFEIDHAKALLNKKDAGEHHPDNLQLLLKYHNGKKNNKNWKRFSIEEQINYIKKTIELQSLVSNQLNINIDDNILNSLIERLKQIY